MSASALRDRAVRDGVLLQRRQQRADLRRLAEAHLVREDPADAVLVQVQEPVQPRTLAHFSALNGAPLK